MKDKSRSVHVYEVNYIMCRSSVMSVSHNMSCCAILMDMTTDICLMFLVLFVFYSMILMVIMMGTMGVIQFIIGCVLFTIGVVMLTVFLDRRFGKLSTEQNCTIMDPEQRALGQQHQVSESH